MGANPTAHDVRGNEATRFAVKFGLSELSSIGLLVIGALSVTARVAVGFPGGPLLMGTMPKSRFGGVQLMSIPVTGSVTLTVRVPAGSPEIAIVPEKLG